MDKAIIDHKTELQNLSDYFLKLSDAVKRGEMSGEEAVKACLEYADHKTEPTISKMEQVDKDINVRSKDEPTTQTETQNSNLTFKTLEYCDICDHKGCKECIANALDEHCIPSQFKKQIEDGCAKEYEELGLKELKELIKADRKDEPLTDCAWRYGDADTEASDH